MGRTEKRTRVRGHHIHEIARYAGVSKVYVDKIESGQLTPKTPTAKKIVKAIEMLHRDLVRADNKVRALFGISPIDEKAEYQI